MNTPGARLSLRTSIAESVRDDRISALYRASTERQEAQARVTFERTVEPGQGAPDNRRRRSRPWLPGILSLRSFTNRPMPRVDQARPLADVTPRGVAVDG